MRSHSVNNVVVDSHPDPAGDSGPCLRAVPFAEAADSPQRSLRGGSITAS